jgi:hypothetical protein
MTIPVLDAMRDDFFDVIVERMDEIFAEFEGGTPQTTLAIATVSAAMAAIALVLQTCPDTEPEEAWDILFDTVRHTLKIDPKAAH